MSHRHQRAPTAARLDTATRHNPTRTAAHRGAAACSVANANGGRG